MHNAYCEADENSLDLRIHPKKHTTCASVRGKRSRSYNYGYVVLELSYTGLDLAKQGYTQL